MMRSVAWSGSTPSSRSSSDHASSSLTVKYASSGRCDRWMAAMVTLMARRSPISGQTASSSGRVSGCSAWYPATTRAATATGSSAPIIA